MQSEPFMAHPRLRVQGEILAGVLFLWRRKSSLLPSTVVELKQQDLARSACNMEHLMYSKMSFSSAF